MNLTHRSLCMAHPATFPSLPSHFSPPTSSSAAVAAAAAATALHQRSPFAIQELLGLDTRSIDSSPYLPRSAHHPAAHAPPPPPLPQPTIQPPAGLGDAFPSWRPSMMPFGAVTPGGHPVSNGMLGLGSIHSAAAMHDHDNSTGNNTSIL